MWFKTAQNQCTTKFSKGQVTKIISPQSVLIDRVPHHIKALRMQHSLTSLEKDSDGTPSESEAESPLCDTEDTESDDSPEEGTVVETLPMLLRRSTLRKRPLPNCHICDHEISGEHSKRRNLPPGSKRVRLRLVCRAVENMFTPEGRSYSGSISSLARRNILHRQISYAGICIKEHASSRSALLLFFVDSFLTDRANKLTIGILRKGCYARVLLPLVN